MAAMLARILAARLADPLAAEQLRLRSPACHELGSPCSASVAAFLVGTVFDPGGRVVGRVAGAPSPPAPDSPFRPL